MERLYRVRGLFRRHGVGQIHADKGDVDILESTHFRNALGIAGEVEPFPAERENVAIAASLVVIELSRLGTTLQVVSGDRFDGPVLPRLAVAIWDGLGC